MSDIMEPGARESGWSVESVREMYERLRVADRALADERKESARDLRVADEKFQTERDRRNTEVAAERARAMGIKETSDLAALSLAREIQTYKDDKADKAREQNLRETGAYVTHEDLTRLEGKLVKIIEPLVDYVSSQRGVVTGSSLTFGRLVAIVGSGAAIMGVVFGLVNLASKL